MLFLETKIITITDPKSYIKEQIHSQNLFGEVKLIGTSWLNKVKTSESLKKRIEKKVTEKLLGWKS